MERTAQSRDCLRNTPPQDVHGYPPQGRWRISTETRAEVYQSDMRHEQPSWSIGTPCPRHTSFHVWPHISHPCRIGAPFSSQVAPTFSSPLAHGRLPLAWLVPAKQCLPVTLCTSKAISVALVRFLLLDIRADRTPGAESRCCRGLLKVVKDLNDHSLTVQLLDLFAMSLPDAGILW